MSMDYKDICLKVAELSQETGRNLKALRNQQTPEAESKGKNDFVTQFDKDTEARLITALSQLLPDSGFIAEENTSDKKGATHNWIIDPIDGTTNFIHGLYPWCISIALMENEEMVVGVVYEAGLDECFYAWKNGGAFLNQEKIAVSNRPAIADSLIATGFPYTNFSLMDQFIESLHFS
ncbi:inositol-1-monophosphatase [Geofilum rubicundum JCM 15548]|uniref:Inositol-1-monophosphatase n=1 Tax=Geofilum rubicundum JCM 15548 TaxID=1236989 RepID=A0A0E9LSR1_9BACT|nr:inositol-1-monophosphatase [Geofilum rubicundum JCM 15548]